jgi:hypothetical protein
MIMDLCFIIDDCHLNGVYREVLLVVVALNVSKGLFSVAYLMVEAKNNDMQRWFVYVLHGYIKTRINNKLLCIIYD